MAPAPPAAATSTASWPIGPPPVIRTLSPGRRPDRSTPCTTVASGSSTAPCSNVTPSGSGTTWDAGTMAWPATPPQGQVAPRPDAPGQQQVRAQPLPAAEAVETAAAEHVREHRDAVAGLDAGDPGAGLGDHRGELVPDDLRQVLGRRVERPVRVLVEVGPADPAPLRLDPGQARPHGVRLRHLIDPQIGVPVEPHR